MIGSYDDRAIHQAIKAYDYQEEQRNREKKTPLDLSLGAKKHDMFGLCQWRATDIWQNNKKTKLKTLLESFKNTMYVRLTIFRIVILHIFRSFSGTVKAEKYCTPMKIMFYLKQK